MGRQLTFAGLVGASLAMVAAALFVLAVGRTFTADPGNDPGTTAPSAAADADVLAATDGYAVWGRQDDGTPVRWDPCTPIRWVLDPRNAPPQARETLSLAMARITAATGIEFTYLGTTEEQPTLERPLTVVGTDGADGRDWAPVLITWVPGGSTDLPLSDNERGVTVPVAVRDGGPRVFVTGQVVFNSDKELLPAFEDRHASWGAVALHELGHLVGLDHVDDPTQLMHPTPGFGPVVLGDGDRAGLAAVGADAGCLMAPTPQELDVSFG